VYVTDVNRVQKFTSEGEFIEKWGTEGTGDGQFNGLFFIEVDGSGNVCVGDQQHNETHRMQKFDANGKFLMSWTRKMMRPRGSNGIATLAVDPSGNTYYAFKDQIVKYDSNGNMVSSYCQNGFSEDSLDEVFGVFADSGGRLYITDASGSIRIFDAEGKLADKWTAENTEGRERLPNGPMSMDNTGNIYVSYLAGVSIWKLSPKGKPLTKFQIEQPPSEGRFLNLGGVAIDDSGSVYAVDSVDIEWIYVGIPTIKKFGLDGQLIASWDVSKMSKEKVKWPSRIAVDGSGTIYVTDQSAHCIHKLDSQGKYIKSWGTKGTGDGHFDIPEGITVDKSGNVYVCDRQNSRIQKFDSNGRFLTKWGKQGSGEGEFHFPAAVALDKKGNIYVADSNNNRIQKFTPQGNFLTEWGKFGEAPGQFNVPLGIAVDALGNVYVSDSHNHRIQKFAPANP
jgi:DNA-binding beta-propeller fold protein YncE